MVSGEKKNVYFRFYAELNDFLLQQQRKTTFAYRFWGTPSIKNAIQALNVPHTEVDLILVNGSPVNFSYQLQPEDRISVYPVFESLDISGINSLRHTPLRRLRFVVDANLGKLARYMRMLGFDALYDNHFPDQEIIRISSEENRVILTRDLGILKNSAVTRGYYLRSQDPREQLQEMTRRFDLISNIKPFSRCMECNGELGRVEKHMILEHLDKETREIFNEFYLCDSCGKVYWKGSHYERMLEMIDRLVKSMS